MANRNRTLKRILSTVVIAFVVSVTSFGQPYKNAAGIKAGYSSGFVFKHFLNHNFVLDGQALYNARGFQFSAFYGYQFSPYDKERLYYYWGAGAFAGSWENDRSIGIALNAGSEFVFRQAPVAVGVEWKPMFNIYRNMDLGLVDFALTVKVILK
ncbi:MAG: hypothetical protein K9J30_03175 [Bacteroidales bacterium]|nr:hypothetical protein [Bacteroidales bacterium]